MVLKFQTTAGFAKSTLVKTFGFDFNIQHARLSLGILCRTPTLDGGGSSRGMLLQPWGREQGAGAV